MVASFDKAIPPGQEGKVTLRVDTKHKRGKVKESAIIFSNDPQNPKTRIFVEGFVKNYITADPSIKIKLQGYYGDKIEKDVTLTSIEEEPLKISDVISTIEDKITCQLEKKDEKTYSVKLNTAPGVI
jgi:hypothetical protein